MSLEKRCVEIIQFRVYNIIKCLLEIVSACTGALINATSLAVAGA
jgi:hypothetical protein